MTNLALVGRLLISLAAVLGLMWLIARRVRKTPGRLRSSKLVDVLGRQQLTRTASVAVVRVMDKALIVGVTDGQVSVLGETDLAGVQELLDEKASFLSVKPSRPAPRPQADPSGAKAKTPFVGSVLSPGTWRQTVDTVRELTVRTR